jgi:hypothetical protein
MVETSTEVRLYDLLQDGARAQLADSRSGRTVAPGGCGIFPSRGRNFTAG